MVGPKQGSAEHAEPAEIACSAGSATSAVALATADTPSRAVETPRDVADRDDDVDVIAGEELKEIDARPGASPGVSTSAAAMPLLWTACTTAIRTIADAPPRRAVRLPPGRSDAVHGAPSGTSKVLSSPPSGHAAGAEPRMFAIFRERN